MATVVAGAFPTRFCSPPHSEPSSTFSMISLPSHTTTKGHNRLRILTRITRAHKKKRRGRHVITTCSNDVESSILAESETQAVEIEIQSVARNTRRIEARVLVEAPLEGLWAVLTDYEALSDFIPGLAQSTLLFQKPNYARIFQVGEQSLGLGIKFNAKGIVDCFEKDLEVSPSGSLSRDIDFDMVQGDFEVFRGKWSIRQEPKTILSVLSYSVEVKPKLWLPVRLVEGILCKEIRINLASIRRQALLITI